MTRLDSPSISKDCLKSGDNLLSFACSRTVQTVAHYTAAVIRLKNRADGATEVPHTRFDACGRAHGGMDGLGGLVQGLEPVIVGNHPGLPPLAALAESTLASRGGQSRNPSLFHG
jgi:hypothetical protein